MTTPAYVIHEVPGKGRGLFAARPIAAGESILVESPSLVVTPLSTCIIVCATCTKLIPTGGAVCQSCHRAVFCCPACEAQGRADPGIHSPVICQAYQAIAQGVRSGTLPPDDDQLESCKFLAHALALRDAAQASTSDAARRWAALSSCCDGAADIAVPSPLVQAFMSTMGLSLDDEALWRQIEGLIRKDEMNTFALLLPQLPHDNERRVRAHALYNDCSAINHDCMPNAARCDPVDGHETGDHRMIIRALQAIPEGQEVCISYAPLDWPYEERSEFFVEHYGFECDCERCWAERTMLEREASAASASGPLSNLAPLSSILHPSGHSLEELETYLDLFFVRYVCQGDECGGTLVPDNAEPTCAFTCNVCGHRRTHEEFLQAMADLQDGHD